MAAVETTMMTRCFRPASLTTAEPPALAVLLLSSFTADAELLQSSLPPLKALSLLILRLPPSSRSPSRIWTCECVLGFRRFRGDGDDWKVVEGSWME